MTDKENDTSGPSQPRMIDIVSAELRDLQADSLKFREQITNAKTSVKRKYFEKKLKKNNKRMMNMLVAFDKLRGRHADTSIDADNAPEPERPEVPSEEVSSDSD
jgi:hypothetical protein